MRHAYQYPDLRGREGAPGGGGRVASPAPAFPRALRQLVFGVSGYGNVSTGAQEILEWLKPVEIPVADLPSAAAKVPASVAPLVKVVFREENMVERRDPGRPFDLQEYYDNPERYAGCFEKHLPYLDVLVNAIYWEPRYPRLVTREWARRSYLAGPRPRLKVIGDISCDIEGSIELTLKATEPDNPCFVYLPVRGRDPRRPRGRRPGDHGRGQPALRDPARVVPVLQLRPAGDGARLWPAPTGAPTSRA